ncbi:MAG TPA: hypothetical protein IAA98_02895 [Candidatus Avipropionibacterium avicola]|uniref:Uncharacterized protein n=1 Tax=Candidatus Avipropionibacterium avicola TaxID=2840701 RepID=A0A9D1KKR9_9ACTN|nr:hypothetical protein [Candidatus Avipropionibacterium avicola]
MPDVDPLHRNFDPLKRNADRAERLHQWFTAEIVDGYAARRDRAWSWDHTGEAAYLASVAERRAEWAALLNPPHLTPLDEVRVSAAQVPGGHWLEVPVHSHLSAEGVLVVPEGARRLIVMQHGLGSWPERVFGIPDANNGNRGLGADLVRRGYAVLAPLNLSMVDLRNRAQDLARLAGTTMEGLELARCRLLLDAVADLHPEVDTGAAALIGVSWGGMAAQFWTPLEDRFVAAASVAFFNDRLRKMVVEDPEHYGTFAARGEHHAFLPNHLGVFADAELASLICPRPFLVQHGHHDPIGWSPQIEAEFTRTRRHWDELGVGDRVELHIHDGGHEVDKDNLLAWVDRNFPVTGTA